MAPRELTAELRALRRLMLRHPSAYIQRAFSLFISLGHHHALLRRQSQAYQKRGNELSRALARHLPDFKVIPITVPRHCWLQGRPGSTPLNCPKRRWPKAWWWNPATCSS